MARTTLTDRRDAARFGVWVLALVSSIAGCASEPSRPGATATSPVAELDAGERLDVDTRTEAAAPTTCIDEDGDGYGAGGCSFGADCDDHDRAVTDACYRCALPATDCPCVDGAAPVGCDVESNTARGAGGVCHPGQRTCAGGRWSRCEPYRGSQQYVGAVSACAGACLAGCRHEVVCPEAGDPFSAECENIAVGSFAPAVFCPTGTAPGGVTSTCDTSTARYVRSTPTFPWIDACGAPGHLTFLQGANDGIVNDALPFAFPFFGVPQSIVQLSANGMLGFPSTSTLSVSEPLATTSLRNALLPFWDDLVVTGGVCTATFGLAPNRQYVAEWRNARFNALLDTSVLTFEVVLTEGSNTIDFAYLTTDNVVSRTRVTGGNATVGLIGANLANADQVAFRTANAVSAGTRFRWTPAGAASECHTAKFVHTITASCENPNEVPVWDVMNVTGSVAPGGAVQIGVRTAESVAELTAAPWVLLPSLAAINGNAPTQIPLTGQLRAANPALGLDRRPVLQLTAMLSPSTDRTVPSVLGGLELQYVCMPNEHLEPCRANQACSLGAGGCRRGITSCGNSAGGRPFETCVEAGRQPVGSTCAPGSVCNADGDCVACEEGANCEIPGAACLRGRVSCSTGAPICVPVEQLPPGTACGGNISTYQRSTSTFDWIDACNAPGRDLYLVGGTDRTQAVTLPFDFTLFGAARRDLTIAQNGVIGFANAAATGANAALPTSIQGDAILPFWDTLATPNGVCAVAVGSAPDRRFVIQFNGAQIPGVANSALDFEVILSESSNAIDVIYKRMAGAGDRHTGTSATIGLQRADGAFADQVGYNAAGVVQTGTTLRWTTNVSAVCAPNGACVPCSPGLACGANGICALGTQSCSAGIAQCVPTGHRAATPEACNNVDDDCDGVVDEECRPCTQALAGGTTVATQTVWQINRGTGPRCWGFQAPRHGDPIEYGFTTVPPADDPSWGPHGNDIYFADPSTLCGVCECRYGGDFTHFQTAFTLPSGYRASSLRIQVGSVDDGVRLSVYNSRYPTGIVDPGSYAYLGGGVTTDLAAYLAPGPNRVVVTHVDDCCRDRIVRGVSIVLDDIPLSACATITNPTQCLPGWADCDGNSMNGCEENLSTSRFACGACGVSCGAGWCDNGVCRASACTNGVRDGNETDVDCGGSCGACGACRACWQNSDCGTGQCIEGQCGFVAERFLDWRSQCTGTGGNDQLTVANLPAGQYRVEALPSAGASAAVSWPTTGWSWGLDGACQGLSVPAFARTASYATRDGAYAALPSTTTTATWAGGALTCRFNDADCRDNQGGVYFRLRMACAPPTDNCPSGWADCDRNPSNGCEVNTGSSLGACGACGRACPAVPNATSTCGNGTCGFTCLAGWADCNGSPADGCEAEVGASTTNCGACGRACPTGPRGVASCVAGTCGLTCESGYANCDGNAANGCEVATGTDLSNCGACGRVCSVANGTAACVNGACGIGSCGGYFRNCDANVANGCERDTASDANNCGACNNRCPARANATTRCSSGACGYICNAGWADCDGSASNGCEVNIGTSITNCGACGRRCTAANGTPVCSGGTCGIGSCNSGYANCDGDVTNGCEVNTNTNANHCGACGRVCSLANASATCTSGACGIGACTGLFRNCDSNASNGCERDTASDVNNCGACNNRCPARANATTTCGAGACGFTCNPGWANCDGNASNGCEVNIGTSTSNCGACGRVCPAANGTAVCVQGACGIGSCNAGWANCDGNPANGCETSTTSNLNNCGACGRVCASANAQATCSASACGLGACNVGWANCDANAANGCEQDIYNDVNNCGGCGVRCGVNQACANGYCVGTGELRYTLTWDRNGDMDIHVTPPCGETISYANMSACNGRLDRDDIYFTGPENIFWLTNAPRGTYNFCVSPYRISGATNWVLRIYTGATLIREERGTSTTTMGFGCSHTFTMNF